MQVMHGEAVSAVGVSRTKLAPLSVASVTADEAHTRRTDSHRR